MSILYGTVSTRQNAVPVAVQANKQLISANPTQYTLPRLFPTSNLLHFLIPPKICYFALAAVYNNTFVIRKRKHILL